MTWTNRTNSGFLLVNISISSFSGSNERSSTFRCFDGSSGCDSVLGCPDCDREGIPPKLLSLSLGGGVSALLRLGGIDNGSTSSEFEEISPGNKQFFDVVLEIDGVSGSLSKGISVELTDLGISCT